MRPIFLACLVLGAAGRAQGIVYSVLSPINPTEGFVDPITLGSIRGVVEMRIHIGCFYAEPAFSSPPVGAEAK